MAIKVYEFNPIGTFPEGNKILNVEDMPGGMSHAVVNQSPRAARRVQNGDLITQTVRYNKQDISLTISFFDVNTNIYFKALKDSGLRMGFKIWTENPTDYLPLAEFDGTVQLLTLNEDTDPMTASRTITMVLSEV